MRYDAVFQQKQYKPGRKRNRRRNARVCGNQMYLERAVNNYLMNAFAAYNTGTEDPGLCYERKKAKSG